MSTSVEHVSGIVTVVAVGVCLVVLIVLHVLPTALSPLRNAVSQYGITPYRLGYRTQTIAMGVSAVAAGIGIAKIDFSGAALIAILFFLFGASRLVIGWFPMDSPDAERTETGRRHGLLAFVAFTCASIGSLRLGGALRQAGLWGHGADVIYVLGIIMVVNLVTMGVGRRHPALGRYFGLIERLFYAEAIVLLVLVGVELARLR